MCYEYESFGAEGGVAIKGPLSDAAVTKIVEEVGTLDESAARMDAVAFPTVRALPHLNHSLSLLMIRKLFRSVRHSSHGLCLRWFCSMRSSGSWSTSSQKYPIVRTMWKIFFLL